jgi:hypothetical protein
VNIVQLPRFQGFVDDNFHPQDELRRYSLGPYRSCAAALAVCEQFVDRHHRLGAEWQRATHLVLKPD